MRHDNRKPDALRTIIMEPGASPYAEGSCLIRAGATHVLCTASIDNRVPHFLRNSGKGWVTAEYGMLPRATHSRGEREAVRGKQSGRTQEIQRLIGRSLRAVMDFEKLGERQIKIDCDVLQADGGTRTAAITGAWVALRVAVEKLLLAGDITESPITGQVAAVSCGMISGGDVGGREGDSLPASRNNIESIAVLDLDYTEDSTALADANFVLTDDGRVVEIQMTAEDAPFTREALDTMLALAGDGVAELCRLQREAVKKALA